MCPTLAACVLASALGGDASVLDVTEVASWPSGPGRAGPVAGHWDGQLVVAGGANVPGDSVWDTDTVWHDDVHVLDLAQGTWTTLDAALQRRGVAAEGAQCTDDKQSPAAGVTVC